MNQAKAIDLLNILGIEELVFEQNLGRINFHNQLMLVNNDIYLCKDLADYESKCNGSNWDIRSIYYSYDVDIDAVVFEIYAFGTDVDEVESLNELFAIVRKDFLEANSIKLIFGGNNESINSKVSVESNA